MAAENIKIPKKIGHGEGGGNLPQLYDILVEIKDVLIDLENRVTTIEGS